MLQQEELSRYDRQMILPELGLSGQEKLKAARVLVIGAGGLGCPVLQYLVAAGVGHIGIVDDDAVAVSNLHRQILYTAADIGRPKAVVASEKLQLLNPFVRVTAYEERLTVDNAARLIAAYDLALDGSDNFPTRYLVNDTCAAQSKPLVFGSIYKFEGQVSVFHYLGGPGYRDLFPEPAAGDDMPNCADIGVIGVLPGIIGTYMANEALKIICGIGETLSGKLFTMNALNNEVNLFAIPGRSTAEVIPEEQEHDVAVEISLDTLTRWLSEQQDSVQLIDVREAYEFEAANMGGINISLYSLAEQLETLPAAKKLVFLCQTGMRSKIAVQLARPFYKGELYSVKDGFSCAGGTTLSASRIH